MRLSTRGRYAVTAMVDLAIRSSDGFPVPLADIAVRQEISLSYLEQLFGKLRKGGLVKSIRGPGGGYAVAHDPADTRVADIIFAVDEPISAVFPTTTLYPFCVFHSMNSDKLFTKIGFVIITYVTGYVTKSLSNNIGL